MNASIKKRASPPPLNRCLFCLGRCSVSTVELLNDKRRLNIPGAGNCGRLNTQLEQIFIVRQLLNLPVQWCEQTLEEQQTVQVGDDEGVWFKVCRKCSETSVQPAWDIYKRLSALQAKINTIKLNIRETMTENILRNKRNRRWSGFTGDGVDREIRKFIFPDLMMLPIKDKDDLTKDEQTIKPRPRPSYYEGECVQIVRTESSEPADEDPVFLDDRDMDWKPIDDFDEGVPASPLPNMSRKDTIASKNLNVARKKRIRKPRKRKPRPINELQRFLCSQCGSYLNSREDFASHLDAHEQSKQTEGGMPFDCTICSFPAQSQEELQRHVKLRHERVRFYQCPKCTFKGKTFIKMKAHVVKEHPDITEEEMAESDINLTCQVCSRKFGRLTTFVIHQKKKHPELFGAESNEPLECQQCGQKYMSKILLDYHATEHLERPSKYVCDECGKSFQFKCRLESHQITHVNKVKRDYVCHLCGVDYAHKGLLRKHYETVHPEQEDGGAGTSLEQSSEEFKCRYCELTSPYKVVIKRHLQTHKEEMGHRCELCGNCYTSDAGLKRHLKLNHPLVKKDFPCLHCRKPFPSEDYMKDHVRLFCKVKNAEQNVSSTISTASVVGLASSSVLPSKMEIS